MRSRDVSSCHQDHRLARPRGVPLALIDDLFALDGLMRDSFGDVADVDVEVDPAAEWGAPFRMTLDSGDVQVRASGEVAARGLLSGDSLAPWKRLRMDGELIGLTGTAATNLAAVARDELKTVKVITIEIESANYALG